MPSKRGKPDKGKGKKGKGKGKEKTPKMSRKEKKLWKKFGTVIAEGPDGKEVAVMTFRRDELEWTVERLREQLTMNRSERIRFQLERDFLYELYEQYRKKLECLLLEQQTLLAQNNRAAQDAEENRIIKGMEGKHFRAETQIVASTQECRDEIRRNKLKDLIERSWMAICADMEEQEAILAKNAEEYKKRIAETQKKLQDLHKYMADHEKQLEEFINNLEREKENSLKLFFVIRRMEYQLAEERWDEFVWRLSINFENSLKTMKNFYNDASFSNFTMMYTLQDMINTSVERMDGYTQKIKQLQEMMKEAHAQMPQLRIIFIQARARHNKIIRSKAGIKTVKKELQLIQNRVSALRFDYIQNFHRLDSTNAERCNFRTNGNEIIQNVIQAYNYRFRVEDDEAQMQQAIDEKDAEQTKLMESFKQFPEVVIPFKEAMKESHELSEQYHVMAIKVRKQNENLRDSLESRLRRLGLQRKHPTVTPQLNSSPFSSQPGRINWGPANLVAGKAFPKRMVERKQFDCYQDPDELEAAVPVCLTNSIQNFMAKKEEQREQKNRRKLYMARIHPAESREYCKK